jgi:DNA-binding MarR family transcriptional regulator
MKKKVMTERNISVVHFENNKLPTFLEVKNRDWIMYGDENNYPEYLITLFNRSAKHNAIVTGKVHYITGNGFEAKTNTMGLVEHAKFENWFNNLNEDMEALLSKVTTDIELFNGCYLEIIPNKLGTGIGAINHIGFEKIRINKTKDGFYYSNDWSKYRQNEAETGLKTIAPYNPNTFSGLYRFKGYRPGNNVYPIPEYVGCVPYIEVDFEISNFHLNNIKNGFVGGTMISFNNGVPLPEEQKIIEGKVKGKFTGTDKAGQLVITFSDNKDTAPTVTPLLPNGFDKMFDTLNETVTQEIFTGHKITSLSLFGIKESKGLGSKDELKQAFELFQNGYVNAKQNIIERIFNDFCEISGFGRPLYISPIEPISEGIPQNEVLKVMTPDEIREKAGLPALNKVAMCSHEKFTKVDSFKNVGKSRKDFRVIKKVEVPTRNDVILREIVFYKHNEKFYDSAEIQPKILNILLQNPSITLEELSKQLGEDKEAIKKEISTLTDMKLLTGKIGQVIEVTPTGITEIENTPTVSQPLEILYSYEERQNLPPLQTESREFCQELMDLDRLYTRQEIELISEQEGRDVWATRGGWFHNSNYDQNTPYCRHIWYQNIVKKK